MTTPVASLTHPILIAFYEEWDPVGLGPEGYDEDYYGAYIGGFMALANDASVTDDRIKTFVEEAEQHILCEIRPERIARAVAILRNAITLYRAMPEPLPPPHMCPCCGLAEVSEEGCFEICKVCGWEDDPVQQENPFFAGGANELSLEAARKLWSETGKHLWKEVPKPKSWG